MKLLQKTIRNYFIYSVLLLLVAIPVFYFVIQDIVREDVDEDLMATWVHLKPKISEKLLNNTVDQLQFLDHDITIAPSTPASDSISFTSQDIYDSVAAEIVPHRILTAHFAVKGQYYVIRINTSLVDNDDLIQSIVQVQVILLLLLLGGLFIINRNLSKSIWEPFYNTVQRLRNYKVENQQPLELSSSSVTEFNDLNQSLKDLTERTHQTFISQKEFTENASHEIQTPLAIFQNKLELLMQTSPINEDQAQLMSDLADASQRMNRLNKNLVLLTKIENNQFMEKEAVVVNRVVETMQQQYQPYINAKNITVVLEAGQQLTVNANKTLIEILISNILANAIRHNHEGGIIKVVTQPNNLAIKNSGKHISLDRKKLFKRFQKDSEDSNSTGLGLAIANKICELNGFSINYTYEEDMHHFIIDFNGA